MKLIAIITILLAGILDASAQRVGIAYWNVDRLYDTIQSPFYHDDDFTPEGAYGWTAERYRRKVEAVAAVVDSMAMPVTVLYGVENETVVRDIAEACRHDYSYLHRTLNSLNGLDFAVLYYGDAVIPERVGTYRRNVALHCRIAGRRTVLLLSRDEDDAVRLAAEIREEEPDAAVIAIGRLNFAKMKRAGVADTFAAEERAGRGESVHNGVWRFGERICADTMLRTSAGVYARPELFDARRRAPLPTFVGRRYTGGTGRYLPMFVTVEWPESSSGESLLRYEKLEK